MAEFAELFEEGFEGAEIMGEGGVETVETLEQAGAEIDAMIDDFMADLDGLGDPAETELDAAEQEAEIESSAKDASKEVKELKKVDVTDIDPWESRKSFGKWVGTEIGKGALFVVGMKVVEAAFEQFAKPKDGKKPSKEAKEAADMAKKSTAAMKIVKKVLEAWNKWLVHNYLKRKSFGSVKAEGVNVWHYQVFQSQVADLNDIRNGAVTKAATKAAKSKEISDIKSLVKKEQKLVKEMKTVSKWLHDNGKKLTEAGLEEYTTDEAKASKLLGGDAGDDDEEAEDPNDPEDPDTDDETGDSK